MTTVNLSPLFNGYQVFNSGGAPLAGGRLYTYLAGTTTPALTYTTNAGSVANTNPIILGTDGRVPQEVWLVQGQSYKFQLNDAADVPIVTYDNITSVETELAAASGSSIIGFQAAGSGAVLRTMQDKERDIVSVKDFSTLSGAAGTGGSLLVPAGTYNITSNLDFGTCSLTFSEGALFNISNGVTVTIRTQIQAGDYQIFSTTGVVVSAGKRNPMWWGAVRTRVSPGATVAAANTLAFRKCCMSFWAEYTLNVGTFAVPGPCIPFSIQVPEGGFYLSNGFAVPVGAPLFGAGVSTLLCRLTANIDTDTAIPMITMGQTLAPAPGLAYLNDATNGNQNPSTFTAAGFPNTAPDVSKLYLVDQNPTKGALDLRYPGVIASDLFITNSGIGINLDGGADMVINNVIIDGGLTGINLGGSITQNARISNCVLYFQTAQAIAVGTNVFDCTFSNTNIEYPQAFAVNIAGGTVSNLKFEDTTITYNASTGTNAIYNNASNVDVEFGNLTVRNLGGASAVYAEAGKTNVVMRFKHPVFDQSKTNPAYGQNANMRAFFVNAGKIIIENAQFRNLPLPSVFVGAVDLSVNGLKVTAQTGSVFTMDSAATGAALFRNVEGDGTTPLITNATHGVSVRVKDSAFVLGTPYADGAFLAWDISMPPAGQIQTTVTASVTGGTQRKTATMLVERSVDAGPNDNLSTATLLASATNPCVPVVVFSNNTATQAATGIPTQIKLRVPNTYTQVSGNFNSL